MKPVEIAQQMHEFLNRNLAHEIKRQLNTVHLREVLLTLADWVYGEQTKTDIELIALRERMKDLSPRKDSSFLDALDEIG